jgi:thiol-disulfide isomerase/thioredoxin
MLHEFGKRVHKGPIAFLLFYADWCSHCHRLMPHFDAASKSKKRTAQVIKVPDYMIPALNAYIKKNINSNAAPYKPDGFPTMYTASIDANPLTTQTPAPDTKKLERLMIESGIAAREAQLNTPSFNRTSMPKEKVAEMIASTQLANESSNSISGNSMKAKSVSKPDFVVPAVGKAPPVIRVNTSLPALPNTISVSKKKVSMPKVSEPNESINELVFNEVEETPVTSPKAAPVTEEIKEITSMEQQLTPPVLPAYNPKKDMIRELPLNQRLNGGGLYGAMAKTAYTLAPAAVLMATAAMTFKNRKRSSNHTSKRKSRRAQ